MRDERRRAGGRSVPGWDGRRGARLLRAQVHRAGRAGDPARAARASAVRRPRTSPRRSPRCRERRRTRTPSATSPSLARRLEALSGTVEGAHREAARRGQGGGRCGARRARGAGRRGRGARRAGPGEGAVEAGHRRARRAVRPLAEAPAGRSAPAQERAQRAVEAVPRRPHDDRDAPQGVLRRARHRRTARRAPASRRSSSRPRRSCRRVPTASPTTAACSTSGSWPVARARRSTTPLWARFKAAGDVLYAAKAEIDAREDEEYRANLELKLALLDRGRAAAHRDRPQAGARRRSTASSAAGTRSARCRATRSGSSRTACARSRTPCASSTRSTGSANDPEQKARSEGLAGQLHDAIEKLEAELAAAKASGDAASIAAAARRRSRRGARGSRPSAADPSPLPRSDRGSGARSPPVARPARTTGDRMLAAWGHGQASRGARHRLTSRSPNSAPRGIDGDLFAIDDGVGADRRARPPEPSRGGRRAQRVSRSLIIERLSAAWVHGALDPPPRTAQFCVPHGSRIAASPIDASRCARSCSTDDEVVELGGAAVHHSRCAPRSTCFARHR